MIDAQYVMSLGHWGMFDATEWDLDPFLFRPKLGSLEWTLYRGEDLGWR